jgi:hypothetical protein
MHGANYTQRPTPTIILTVARHAAHVTCTPWDKQTRFSTRNKDKRKNHWNVPDLSSNIGKSMTHHNKTKELATWFLNLPFDEPIDNKKIKFEVQIQDHMKHS